MFDIPLRQVKDRLFLPLVPYIPNSITPNHITILAFLVGLAACFAATNPTWHWTAAYFWLLNRLLDNLDGALARSRDSASELGGFLDLLSDFIIYSLLPICITYGQSLTISPTTFLTITLLEASFHVNNFVLFYTAAIASGHKTKGELTSLTMKPALVEGFESGVIFTAMLIWPRWVGEISCVLGVGVVVGTAQRVWGLVGVLREGGEGKWKGEKGMRERKGEGGGEE